VYKLYLPIVSITVRLYHKEIFIQYSSLNRLYYRQQPVVATYN